MCGLFENYDSIADIQVESMWLRILIKIAFGCKGEKEVFM